MHQFISHYNTIIVLVCVFSMPLEFLVPSHQIRSHFIVTAGNSTNSAGNSINTAAAPAAAQPAEISNADTS